jgi:uncharacterized protein (DUF2147 family)
MKLKVSLFLALVSFLFTDSAFAQSPIGIWKTIDDSSGSAKSHIEIYEQNGKVYGKIIKTLRPDAKEYCEKCSGDKKNKPIIGLVILEDLKPVDDYWAKGTIVDPENGKEYGASIWFEDGESEKLQVRGKHWTGLYRTQTWHRIK